MTMTDLILVDEQDREVGTAEKLDAHEKGLLHRAFSICVFDTAGRLMLQQRAKTKYHCGGLWSNTCCGHPMPGERVEQAAHRRLGEEMGFDCPLEKVHELVYRVPFENGLTEHEYLHVFAGTHDGEPSLNPEEADAFAWADIPALQDAIAAHPETYTYWFKLILPTVLEKRSV
jgi:isopentenyl-diphosphate delta-isomerase